jgi:hypothetical protein
MILRAYYHARNKIPLQIATEPIVDPLKITYNCIRIRYYRHIFRWDTNPYNTFLRGYEITVNKNGIDNS